MQTFSSDSFILNHVQSLSVIVSKNEEEIDFSISNVVASVHKSNALDFLEEISYFRSDPFTLIYLYLPTNSYMITCTNTQSFVEEGDIVHMLSQWRWNLCSLFLDLISP